MGRLCSWKNEFTIFIKDIILFDMWLGMKMSLIGRYIIKLCTPTFKILLWIIYLLGVAAVFVGTYLYVKYPSQTSTVLIGIQYSQNTDTNLIAKDLQTRNEEKDIESVLFEMKRKISEIHKWYSVMLNKELELPDFASEAAGGFIIDTPDTEVYKSNTYISVLGIPIWKVNEYSARKILQPWSQAGECWPFKGHYGKVKIHLAFPAYVHSFTLEHIPVTASLTGSIISAPKNFRVFGSVEQEYVLLGSFIYNIKGYPSQKFFIQDNKMKGIPVKKVLLEILSNWGHPEYTCIYRFRVHGNIHNLNDDSIMINRFE